MRAGRDFFATAVLATLIAGGAARAAPAGEVVSLADALAYAEAHAPLLALARARAERGEAEVSAAGALLPSNPELRAAAGPRIGSEGTGWDLQLSIEQRLEIAGERGLRLDAARALRSATRSEIEQARWLVHRLVHAAYAEAVIARERAGAATQVLQWSERMLEIAARRHGAGDVSAIDVKLAENELAQARETTIKEQAAYRAARLSLAELCGWPVDRPLELGDALDVPRDVPALDELLARARRYSPVLRARALAIREADARVALADREVWPEPSIGLSYERESDPGNAPGADVHVGLVTLGIPLPFWQRNQGERARARADAAAARAEREAWGRGLIAQVARAADGVNSAAARVRAYGAEIVPGLAQNLALLQRAYELGELDVVELMVARGRFLEVQRDALSARDDYHHALGELEELLGTEPWSERASSALPKRVEP